MNIRLLTLFCVLFLLPTIYINAQEQHFRISSHAKGDRLPKGEIHGVVQDELGFVWIASDAGLIRFDGGKFKQITSRQCKYVYQNASGRVLVIDESGFWEIHSLPENPILTPIPYYESLRELKNPRFMEDHKERLWISSVGKASRSSNGPPLEFEFPEDERVHLAEDQQGKVWAMTSSGRLYLYNPAVEAFDKQDWVFPERITNLSRGMGRGFWVGTEKGVWRMSLTDPSSPIAEKLVNMQGGATFIANTNAGIFVGSERKGLQRLIQTDQGSFRLERLEDHTFPHGTQPLPFTSAKYPFIDHEGGLWVVTEKGVSHLMPNIFDAVDVVPKGNIHGLTQVDNGDMYVVQGGLFRIHQEDGLKQSASIAGISNATAVASYSNRVWVGFFNGDIAYYENDRLSERLPIRDTGGLILNMASDDRGNVWVSQLPNPKAYNGIACVSPSMKIKYYGEKEGFKSRVLVTRQGENGELYFGATGNKHYLYQYDPTNDKVIDLSVNLDFKHRENFEVHDLRVDFNDVIWLATTDGLLRYKDGKIEQINLGPVFTNTEIRGLDLLGDGTLWLATDSHGIIKYTTQGYTSFSEHNGLITNISNYRNILVDQQGAVWIGTSEGLELSQSSNPTANPTLPPMLTGIRLSKSAIDPTESHTYEVPSDSYMALGYLTLTFSEEEILYQTRIMELGRAWSEPSKARELVIPELKAGRYTFEVRAKEQSGHKWSKSSQFQLEVYTIWYLTPMAYIIYGVIGVICVYTFVRLNTMRLRQRSKELETMIMARTNEIRQQTEEIEAQKEELSANNEQLIDLNNEKNYYISVVAHDLKSPLNRVISLIDRIKLESGELPAKTQEYLQMIHTTVSEQRHLIGDILDLQAIESHVANIDMQQVELAELMHEMVEEFQINAQEKNIQVHWEAKDPPLYIWADPHYVRQMAENILSNALKFSNQDSNIYVNMEHRKKRVKLSVRDEGPGISQDDQQKIFRKFQKLTATPTAGEHSAGMGLSIVKKFAEEMGARIWCKSKVGEGTTFIVEFDEMPPSQMQEKSTATSNMRDASK